MRWPFTCPVNHNFMEGNNWPQEKHQLDKQKAYKLKLIQLHFIVLHHIVYLVLQQLVWKGLRNNFNIKSRASRSIHLVHMHTSNVICCMLFLPLFVSQSIEHRSNVTFRIHVGKSSFHFSNSKGRLSCHCHFGFDYFFSLICQCLFLS